MSENADTKKKAEESPFIRAMAEMQTASDRAVAIVGCALIEEELKAAIITRFTHKGDIAKAIFEPNSALNTYEARVSLGFLLGVFNGDLKDALIGVSKIRNKFAHLPEIGSFNEAALHNPIKNVKEADMRRAENPALYAQQYKNEEKRETFVRVINSIILYFVLYA